MPSELYQQFTSTLESAAEKVWQRFQEQMPARYFRETDAETQLSHLHLLSASAASGVEQDLVLRSQDGSVWTFLTNQSRPGQLGQFLKRLPAQRTLTSARAYTSKDGHWVIDVFEFGRQQPPVSEEEFEARLLELGGPGSPRFREHLRGCQAEYVRFTTAAIAQAHFELVEQARETGNLAIGWEQVGGGRTNLRLVVEGSEGRRLFERIARYLGNLKIDIERAYVTSFGPYQYLGFLIRGADPNLQAELGRDLGRLHYLNDSTLDLWEMQRGWSLEDCEIAHFLVSLAHQLLIQKDVLRFARARLEEAVTRNPELAQLLFDGFRGKSSAKLVELVEEIPRFPERVFFHTCIRILESIQVVNLEVDSRRSLAARVEAALFCEDGQLEPFAVFYAVGRGFEGFHVRFQDVARGGMRLVCPRSQEAHSLECEKIFQEAYGLAQAQHLKNKDIPEGGAKAVVLVEPGVDPSLGGRAFADALLDLTLRESTEFIYLGPDENVSNELIEWISERAARRGHPLPSTFMSSKPGAGINHKEYGITSEGVTVYLEVALRRQGLDPETQPFTVKLTGGPDGDVAGNELKILLSRYPNTARVVGIADGSGSAEDPAGLDRDELLRLVEESLPVSHFSKDKLGEHGRVTSISESGGVQLRNSLHNRLTSDAFVPAGGRPHTMHAGNWEEFLTGGEPSSRLIVEGANLFLSEQARQQLSQRGVTIVKDSSANKCGVICSSFEILASMLLAQEEFLEVKETFVEQVIERLRSLAGLEAELLFQERRLRPDLSLPELSVRLSKVLLQTTEAVASYIEDPLNDERFGTDEVLLDYLPPVLRERAADRVTRIPPEYRRRVVACSLAGKLVYREGITYLEDLPKEAMQELVMTYLEGERSISRLVAQVRESGLPDAVQITELLEMGGARTLTRLRSQ